MEKTNNGGQEPQMLWINKSEHIVSFHKVENDDYEPLIFSDQNEKMKFVFEKCSSGFRIQ